MTDIDLPDHLIQQLEDIARREDRSAADVLESLLSSRKAEARESGDAEQGIREVRALLYKQARTYWQRVGDVERLALSDAELDEQFWLIDPEGIPRLLSEQGQVNIPPDPLLIMAEAALEANLIFSHNDVAQRSRDILNAEFGDTLYRRMQRDLDEPDSD